MMKDKNQEAPAGGIEYIKKMAAEHGMSAKKWMQLCSKIVEEKNKEIYMSLGNK